MTKATSNVGIDSYRLRLRVYVPPHTSDSSNAISMARFLDDFSTPDADWVVIQGDRDVAMHDIRSKSFPQILQRVTSVYFVARKYRLTSLIRKGLCVSPRPTLQAHSRSHSPIARLSRNAQARIRSEAIPFHRDPWLHPRQRIFPLITPRTVIPASANRFQNSIRQQHEELCQSPPWRRL
jgi:hypothetical protein